MRVESWARVSELFMEAVLLPAAERQAFLGKSAIDAEVRAELERLLAAHERGGDSLDEPFLPPSAPAPRSRIGNYTLLRVLGSGGMGTVYEALQDNPQRTVALKTLRLGFSSPARLQRFQFEAEVLGNLRHPSVAQIYEAGTHEEEGQLFPYFAMELVAGARDLLSYARMEGLSREARIALFLEVCDAVHHGHQKGVIHRDLKAGNILVDAEGRVKVIDFGVARATGERKDAERTQAGQIVGTLATMSPEQLASDPDQVDVRSDVYSLGVVLYELLAGKPPYDLAGLPLVEALQVVREGRAPRAGELPRELNWIALRALEKDPARRYASVLELAADLRRYLAHEPVLARAPSKSYLARKFVQRNKTVVAALSAIVLVLVLGIVGTSWQAARAERVAGDVLRLSALQKLEDLVAEADALWPPFPENVERYEAWLAKAAQLMSELPDHRAKLAELRARARPASEAERAAALDSPAPEWTFDDDQDKWWHNQLEKLITGLESFSDDATGGLLSGGVSPDHGWGVERRLDFARSIEARSLSGPEASARWDEALASIRDPQQCPWYARVELSPQLGLLPIGQDPDSGLWEFAHLQSGEPATRAADGRLVMKDETGLVFVLLPGGTFHMGAQNSDPRKPNYDPLGQPEESPVRAVTLSPFFLSKYEMTQGQWQRTTGSNPSGYGQSNYDRAWNAAGRAWSSLHPVEEVNWYACTELCAQLGLSLPSEAQWEYAVRGDTETPWWPGEDPSLLAEVANLADSYASRYVIIASVAFEPWNDGQTFHGPIGELAANPFGLHDILGNVWEWCLDACDLEAYQQPATKDPIVVVSKSGTRVSRGGSFFDGARSARSATRAPDPPESAGHDLGLRPARHIDP